MKVLLFSHKSDIDGMGNAILASIAFNNIDYILSTNVHDLEEKITTEYKKGTLNNYDRIYITDLSISNSLMDSLEKDQKLNNRIYIFDHHETPLKNGLNNYNNVTIMTNYNNRKTCATEIFYNYLTKEKYLEKSQVLNEFVELVRNEDTYDWKRNNNKKAHDLAILYQSLGPLRFITQITNKLKNTDTFNFTKEDLIQACNEDRYLVLRK